MMNSLKKTHITSQCKIDVDEEIVDVVQFILDNYMYKILPFASCQNQNDEAYISVTVSNPDHIDKLMEDFKLYKDEIHISYFPKTSNYFRTFYLQWNSTLNAQLSRLCREINKFR